jgi:hypothetical protein
MKFKAGRYYIGDLFYVVSSKDWQKIVGHAEDEDFQLRGKPVFVAGTAYGDGEYFDSDGNRYSVDTGTIGIIPAVLCDKKRLNETVKGRDGYVESFARAFEVQASGGRFQFGHILIATDGSDDEEAEECDCNCCPH